MRVTQQSMYRSHLNNINGALSQYMEANMQSASQKQVNKPSDDPAGTARVLMYRNSISDISQYERNLSTAQGWLNLADYTLSLGDAGVTTVITKIKTLAEQAATGTLTEVQRGLVATEMRELFGSLLNLSNTRYGGSSIFAGLNYDSTAFEMGLAADCGSATWLSHLEDALNGIFTGTPEWITYDGSTDSTVLVRFSTNGQVPPPPPNGIDYEYTTDGGETWITGTIPPGSTTVDLGSLKMNLPTGAFIPAYDEDDKSASQIVIRPTAIYQGADNDMIAQIVSDLFNAQTGGVMDIRTTGNFSSDVQVRFDTAVDPNIANQDFTYSYSTDGGKTWIERQANTGAGTGSLDLVVPGGFVTVEDLSLAGAIPAGAEFTIKPQRTNINVQGDSYYSALMNNVGKDIFGGQYYTLNANGEKVLMTAMDGGPENLFETVGKLIAALELNNQDQISQGLKDLDAALQVVTTAAADVGARLSALSITLETLDTSKESQRNAMSSIEDVDYTELLLKLSRAQLCYSSILQSSSMIMQMSLLNYI